MQNDAKLCAARRFVSRRKLTFICPPGTNQENHSMAQLTLDLPKFKNGNGGKHGRTHEHDLANDLKRWLSDLDAAEVLKKELRQISELRSGIYRLAKTRDVSSAMLRVARKLLK
jgi:hypothetical protein